MRSWSYISVQDLHLHTYLLRQSAIEMYFEYERHLLLLDAKQRDLVCQRLYGLCPALKASGRSMALSSSSSFSVSATGPWGASSNDRTGYPKRALISFPAALFDRVPAGHTC